MQLITILGQTSSGKSDLAVNLAKIICQKKRVCIVGCDSRQVYKGLNIGTGKVEGNWKFDQKMNQKIFEFESIPHFMIDFVDPQIDYTLQNYILDFYNLMTEIQTHFDFVILAGGTGLYAKAIIEKIDLGIVKSDCISDYSDYKITLQNLGLKELQQRLNSIKIELNNSDYNNKVRLVSNLLKHQSIKQSWLSQSQYFDFKSQHLFAVKIDQYKLQNKIKTRLQKRFDSGLLLESSQHMYLGQDKFLSLGLEYRQAWLYLNGKINKTELCQNLSIQNLQYAKRQLTWLKKQKNIVWIKNLEEIVEYIGSCNLANGPTIKL